MAAYVLRRLVEVILALFIISTLIFILLHLSPGGPCAAGASSPATITCADYLRLDDPVVEQYATFLGNYLQGNLGTSLQPGALSVATILADHVPATVLLVVTGFLLQQVIALPLGMMAAVRRYSLFDGVFSVLSYIFLSTPAFLLGFTLISFVAVDWGWLPPQRASDIVLPIFGTGDWFGLLARQPGLLLGDLLRHLMLPAITLAVVGVALDSRFTRASMLQVLDDEYIRTARAKGVPSWIIIFKHAFRNALPPIITNLGLYLPALVGSAIVVEWTFTYTGIGYTFVQAIEKGDTTLEQAIFLLTTVAVLLGNLVADVGYALADPRVRYG